jgi:branched-chain amino acid aminotransferase
MKVWLNGSFADPSTAGVGVLDHGLLYGDGVFEGLRVFNSRVFSLDLHMKRLGVGLKALALDCSIPALREAVLATASAHRQPDAYLRLVVTRGQGPLGVDPTTCKHPTVFCIAAPLTLYSAEKLATGLDLVTASMRRPAADVLDPRVKSLNYLNNAMAKLEARQRGVDEALLLNTAGHVAEAAVANVFVVRDGELQTPPGADGALEGITRHTMLRLARELQVPARVNTLTRFDVLGAEEVFLTGSGAGLVPVRSLDDRPVGQLGPGPLFKRLLAAYRELTAEQGVPLSRD